MFFASSLAMSDARRVVRFSKKVQKYKACEVGADDLDEETPWAFPTQQQIQERGQEVAQERRLIRESPKQLHALLALGLAAELRAEMEPSMNQRDARKGGGRVRHQDSASSFAYISRDVSPFLDAEDVENLMDFQRMTREAQVCMDEVCAGITVFNNEQGQIIDIPSASASSGSCSISPAGVAQGSTPLNSRSSQRMSMSSGNGISAASGERTHRQTLPALQRAPVPVPTKPDSPAPFNSRPRPPPPPRKRLHEAELNDHTSEQAV
eukprot:TRINITY_DN12778_c0_g3_i1.p1 TRINITY_DN12778_c0_g3~~TRINITY_DN12778_c0_g3_i1.p1  ORF type:complete len:266 (-),score=36.58 TRINITY_DN12778_c0_g3_i1:102-899(-)